LIGVGLRSRIKIGCAGKVITAFDLARMMALGADWCNAGRGFMMALRSLSPASALPLAIVVFLIFGSFTETYFDQYNTFAWIFFVAAMLYPVRDRIVGRSAVEAARMR